MTRRPQTILAIFFAAAGITTVRADGPAWLDVEAAGVVDRSTPVTPSAEMRKRYPARSVSGEYLVYIDRDGDVARIETARSIPGCDADVVAQLEQWTWKHVGQPLRVHVPVAVNVPGLVAGAPRARNVPPEILDAQAIDEPYPHLPDAVRARHAGQSVRVGYFMTVGTDGSVAAVDPVAATPDIDPVVIATVSRWRFKPQKLPLRTMIQFVFDIPPAPRFR